MKKLTSPASQSSCRPPSSSRSTGHASRNTVDGVLSGSVAKTPPIRQWDLEETTVTFHGGHVRLLARLETECAQRAAGEARTAELVEQIRTKAQQFQAQNAANVSGAEQQLARLSDEFQRSLQAEHALRIQAQEGELRIEDLHSLCEAASVRLQSLVDEGTRSRRLACKEREAHEDALHKIRLVERETNRIRDKLSAAGTEQKKLASEVAQLEPLVARSRRIEEAKDAIVAITRLRCIQRMFDFWLGAREVLRREFEGIRRLAMFRRRSMILLTFKFWRRARIGRSIRSVVSGRPFANLVLVLLAWSSVGLRLRRRRLFLTRHYMALWKSAGEWSAELVKASIGKRFCYHAIDGWRAVLETRKYALAHGASAYRIFRRRFLSQVLHQFYVVIVKQRDRSETIQNALSTRKAKQRKRALKLFTIAKIARLRIRSGIQNLQRKTCYRLVIHAFTRLHRNATLRRPVTAVVRNSELHEKRFSWRRVVRNAFIRWRNIVRTSGDSACRAATLQSRVEMRAVICAFHSWRYIRALRKQASKLGCGASRRCKRRGLSRWLEWCAARRGMHQRNRKADLLFHARCRRCAQSAFKILSLRVGARRIIAVRFNTVNARTCLNLKRLAFSAWDDVVYESTRAACFEIEGDIEAFQSAAALRQTTVQREESTEMEMSLRVEEIKQKSESEANKASELHAEAEFLIARNTDLTNELEAERQNHEPLEIELEKAKAEEKICAEEANQEIYTNARITMYQAPLWLAYFKGADSATKGSFLKVALEREELRLSRQLRGTTKWQIEHIDAFDQRVALLERQRREDLQAVERMEKEIETASFRKHMQQAQIERLQLGC